MLLASLSKILILALVAPIQAEVPVASADGTDAGASQQTAEQEAAARRAAAKRETEAIEAWRKLQGSFQGPKQSTRAAFEKYLDELFHRVEQFSIEYAGTGASFEARHELALMEIHARQQQDKGLARMKQIHADALKYTGTPPDGLRLDLKRYTFVYAIALADAEQFLQAEALLHPIAAAAKGKPDDSTTTNSGNVAAADAAQAAEILARIKVQKTLLIGLPMPEFSGKKLRDGEELKLSDLKGKVVLIQFWATWSKPCDQEMPAIARLYQELADQEFVIVGVSLDDDRRAGRSRLLSYLKQKNMPWPQLFDGKGWEAALAKQFYVRSIPTSFLLDKDGIIRDKNLRARELPAAILPLLK